MFLDRNITAILAHRPKTTASARQKQQLAAIIHLCGARLAKAFAHRGFHRIDGERCGDQKVATYLEWDEMRRSPAARGSTEVARSTSRLLYAGTPASSR